MYLYICICLLCICLHYYRVALLKQFLGLMLAALGWLAHREGAIYELLLLLLLSYCNIFQHLEYLKICNIYGFFIYSSIYNKFGFETCFDLRYIWICNISGFETYLNMQYIWNCNIFELRNILGFAIYLSLAIYWDWQYIWIAGRRKASFKVASWAWKPSAGLTYLKYKEDKYNEDEYNIANV